jgi:hypothetical protein
MKKIMLLAVAVLAIAAAGPASSVANADNGATTTHFTASYTDPGFGPVVCSGENIYKTAPNAFNKDDEDCTALNGFPAGTYTGFGWISDSSPPSHSAGLFTTNTIAVVTDNGDGTSNIHIIAYY